MDLPPGGIPMSTILRSSCLLISLTILAPCTPLRAQTATMSPEELRQIQHQDPQWELVKPHLPDPDTASAAKLELAGDILRARRFQEDALDYYRYALNSGGDQIKLLNKMGVTEMELRQFRLAHLLFQKVVQLKKNGAEGWNNLGATEYLEGHYGGAISDYKRAIKLNKKSAVFHSNLGTAYFDQKEYDRARQQYDIALTLDPQMFEHQGGSGITAHMLSPEDHARYCYEMARLYAQKGDEDNMLHFLTTASEAGFDVLRAMGDDSLLQKYRKDPRVLLMVQNAKALRDNRVSVVAGDRRAVPPLLPAAH
jgi:tetratricopeptide (TPR) repeat protein